MSCECPDTTYAAGVSDSQIKYELGPAYEDYKKGKSGVRLVWKQNKSLMPMFIDPCCADEEPDWTFSDDWKQHTTVLVCYYVVAIALLAAFLALRTKQPLKFRDAKTAVVLWVILVTNMTLGVMNHNMAGTSPTQVEVLMSFCLPPLVLTYYITKALQLWFVHEWSEAKAAKHKHEKAMFFHRYRFLLTPKFFMCAMLFTLVVTVVPVLYAMFGRPTFSDAPGNNMYSNVRCSWWEIPEEYTVKKSDSLICNCVYYNVGLPDYTKSMCESSIFNVCFGSGAVAEDAGFCTTCQPSDLAAGVITKACENWFWEFYSAGNCGHFTEVPHQKECAFGIIADQVTGYVCAAICYAYVLVNLGMIIALCRKRDEFGVVNEMLAACVAVTGTLFFQYVGLFPNYGGMLEWYYGDLEQSYRAIDLFRWLFLWSTLLISFAFPLCLYAYRAYIRRGHASKKRRPNSTRNTSTPTNAGGKRHRRSSSGNLRSEVSSEAERVSATTQSNDDADFEIENCISTPELREIYMKFAIESFHVENVLFMVECQELLQVAKSVNAATAAVFLDDCRRHYDKFLQTDASMEVNVASKKREAVLRAMDQLASSLESSRGDADGYSPILTAHLEQLNQALGSLYHDIRLLLSRDAWPRFMLSSYYPAYQEFLRAEQGLAANILELVSEIEDSAQHETKQYSLEFDDDEDDSEDEERGVEMKARMTDGSMVLPPLVMKVLSTRSTDDV